ncbi:hypothetical protein [Flavobacterium sp. UBA7682]|uniref:hypothetical protein n=1 Tax=Flavobacterium sp. UBA7682 TaxID=1946560 RepID=UPI0025C5567F|nr:hypothetical protein [Flavobacterium sp. UBA7682]
MNYYRVLFSNDYAKKKGIFGLVETLPDADLHLIAYNKPFPTEEINKYKFYLEKGVFADLQMCINPWRIVSKKLKYILDEFKDDNTFFYSINLFCKEKKLSEEYFILHFRKTAGFNESDFSDSLNKVKNFHFQGFDDSITGVFFVSELVKIKIEANNLTGMSFDKL